MGGIQIILLRLKLLCSGAIVSMCTMFKKRHSMCVNAALDTQSGLTSRGHLETSEVLMILFHFSIIVLIMIYPMLLSISLYEH